MSFIRTVKGDVDVETLGLILPHEHLFTDLRGPLAAGYGKGDPVVVERVLRPHLDAIERAGVTAFVECTGLGVGRNIHVLRYLADHTPIHIVAPTGVYKETFTPPEVMNLSVEALAERFVQDLTEGIDGTDSRAGFIKLGMSDDGPTEREIHNLQAGVLASKATGAVIASHTIGGTVAQAELQALETAGHDLRRFIWVHAHTESDAAIHLDAAKRGAYLEFDGVGAEDWIPQVKLLEIVLKVMEAGYIENILLSHDAGWYEPGQPDGQPKPNGIRGYTALTETFIPALKARGVSEDEIRQMTAHNPARAFAMG